MRILPIALALSLAPVPCAARPQATARPFTRTLVGRVGGRDARLVLSHFEGRLEGRLDFVPRVPTIKGRPTATRLEGTVDADGRVELAVHAPERPEAGECGGSGGVLRGSLRWMPRIGGEPLALRGTWTTDDGRDLALELDERLPLMVGPYRLVSRTLAGESDDPQLRDLVRTTDVFDRPVPSYYVELTRPDLVGRDGRPARWFRRRVDTILFGLMSGYVDDCSSTQQTTFEDEESRLVVDYEVVYASPRVVSILFRQRGHCHGVPDREFEEESGLNVDLRTREIVRFDRQFTSPRFGRRLVTDLDLSVSKGTVFDDGTGVPDTPGGDYGGWYFDEHGVSMMHSSALTTTGAFAYVVIPWAYLRRALEPSSPLYRVAFPPPKRVSGPSA